MRKLLCLFIMGLSLNTVWAVEVDKNTPENEELTLQKPIEPLETTDPHKFADLVKSTMELMGPDLEITQATEVTELSPE